jgi:hypothetical protein
LLFIDAGGCLSTPAHELPFFLNALPAAVLKPGAAVSPHSKNARCHGSGMTSSFCERRPRSFITPPVLREKGQNQSPVASRESLVRALHRRSSNLPEPASLPD